MADVQGNGVWVYDGSSRREVAQKRVGTKLTHAVGLSDDLAAFADTDGGAVLIERINPEITEVARIEAPGKPYGSPTTPQRRRLYVTLTATNQLQVVDLADPGSSADHRCRPDRAAAQFRCRGSAFGGGTGHWEQSGRDAADRHTRLTAER